MFVLRVNSLLFLSVLVKAVPHLDPAVAYPRSVIKGSATLPVQKIDNGWFAQLGYGTPPQNVWTQLDSGSGQLWVSDASALSCAANGEGEYTPTSSSSFMNGTVSPDTFSVNYLGGGVSGYRAKDTVTFGSLGAPSTIIGVATNCSNMGQAGLVGLSVPHSGYKAKSDSSDYFLIDSLQQYLDDFVFTTNFKESGGSITFGTVDPTQYQAGTMSVAIPVDAGDLGWNIKDIYFSVGGQPVPNLSVSSDLGFDTGTGNTALPDPVTDAFYAGIDGVVQDGMGFSVPCSASMPSIGFHYKSVDAAPFVTIPGGNITLNPDCGDGACDGRCTTQVQKVLETYTNGGNPFLQSAFVVWRPDVSSPSMAFAAQA